MHEEHTEDTRDETRKHLDDIEDGAGCVEIWEKLAQNRLKENAD